MLALGQDVHGLRIRLDDLSREKPGSGTLRYAFVVVDFHTFHPTARRVLLEYKPTQRMNVAGNFFAIVS